MATTTTTERTYEETILDLLPPQGSWDAAGYLWLTEHTNRLIEFTDGFIEVLPMPTPRHQAILQIFFLAFYTHLHPQGGVIHFAPLRVRIRGSKFREPDLLLLCDGEDARHNDRFWEGADLVLEVVSPDDPERDLVVKVRDYAEARVPEYWIVNPLDGSIAVLTLQGASYAEHGRFRHGERATSALLPDFGIDVSAALDAR